MSSPPQPRKGHLALAFISALTAGTMWGVSGTVAQVLFQHDGFSPAWLVGIRMSAAGILLLVILRPKITRQDLIPLTIFGIVGLGIVQFTYYGAIQNSNVATATFIQYLSPAVVALWEILWARRLPSRATVFAIFLALVGTAFIVFSGARADVTPAALIYGLASAVSMAFYSTYPVGLVKRLGAWTTTSWGLFIGGIAFEVYHPFWQAPLTHITPTVLGLIAYVVLLGTLIPFGLYLVSLRTLPPTHAMIAATFEPVAAALFAFLLLGQMLGPRAYLGGAFVIAAVLTLAFSFRSPSGERPSPTPIPPTP